MSIISTKNKFYQDNLKVAQNQVLIEKLKSNIIKSEIISFNKKQQTINILTNEEVLYGDTLKGTYSFSNLDSKYLHLLQPYITFSTLSAYNFDTNLISYNSYFWWEELTGTENNTLILKFRADGYLVHSLSPLLFAPLYVNVQIKVYNSKLFTLLYGIK